MTKSENIEQPGFMVKGSQAFKIAQALYNTVTGKTEKLSKRFSENYKIEINDIIQLHAKVEQMCAQWNVIESNENITIHHINDNKEVFSSLERFKVYDQSQTSPVESIVYEFNLLIQLSNTPKPQPYQITVRFDSKIAIQEKMLTDLPGRVFIRLFRGGAINLDIDYVDYVVARNIVSTIDSWVSTIETAPNNKALKILQNHSHNFGNISGFILMIIALITSVSFVNKLSFSIGNNQQLAEFLLVSFGFIITSYFIGKALGTFIANGLNRVFELSYIKINVGDEKAIESAIKKNKKSFTKVTMSFLLVTAHAIGSSYFAAILYESLN